LYTKLKEFSIRVNTFKDAIQNEHHNRTVLIEPIIKMLGFDTANPFEVISEYTCDIGTKKGEKVDYALMRDNEIVMLIEAKDCKVRLNAKNVGQLFRYYSTSSARVALLTNGLEYLFFTDTMKQNVMDSEPFFAFNMLDFTESDAEVLGLFKKDVMSSEKIREYAISSTFSKSLTDYFVQQAVAPTNDFIAFIIKNIGLSNLNSSDANRLVSKEMTKLLTTSLEVAVTDEKVGRKRATKKLDEVSISEVKEEKKERKERIIGLISLSDLNSDNIVGTKPINIVIDDQTYGVTSWTDVLIATIKHCVHLSKSKEFILELDGLLDDAKGWVKSINVGLRSPKEVVEADVWVDTHGSAYTNMGRVKNVIGQLKIEHDNVLVELA
jgi:hypothetical protein